MGITIDILKDETSQGKSRTYPQQGITDPYPTSILSTLQVGIKKFPFPMHACMALGCPSLKDLSSLCIKITDLHISPALFSDMPLKEQLEAEGGKTHKDTHTTNDQRLSPGNMFHTLDSKFRETEMSLKYPSLSTRPNQSGSF